jgi:DNA mismatch endonuclease, patch repair protein
MSRQRTVDTQPELALRRALHAAGMRYRLHQRPLTALRRSADLIFPGTRVAVFVDGCFWHGCREHRSIPRSNHRWWKDKIERNQRRDRDTDNQLKAAGWISIRVWEHDDPLVAAAVIRDIVQGRLKR